MVWLYMFFFKLLSWPRWQYNFIDCMTLDAHCWIYYCCYFNLDYYPKKIFSLTYNYGIYWIGSHKGSQYIWISYFVVMCCHGGSMLWTVDYVLLNVGLFYYLPVIVTYLFVVFLALSERLTVSSWTLLMFFPAILLLIWTNICSCVWLRTIRYVSHMAWHSRKALCSISLVTLHRAGLVLAWVTVTACGQVNHLGM